MDQGFWILYALVWVAIIGSFVLILRLFWRWFTYGEYVETDTAFIVNCVMLFILVPFGYIGLTILAFLRPPHDELLSRRRKMIRSLTGNDIYRRVDEYILTNNMTETNWVKGRWRAGTEEQWKNALDKDIEKIREKLEEMPEVTITPRGDELAGDWVQALQKLDYKSAREAEQEL